MRSLPWRDKRNNVILESWSLEEKKYGLLVQSVRCDEGGPWAHKMRLAIMWAMFPICDDIERCKFNPIPQNEAQAISWIMTWRIYGPWAQSVRRWNNVAMNPLCDLEKIRADEPVLWSEEYWAQLVLLEGNLSFSADSV